MHSKPSPPWIHAVNALTQHCECKAVCLTWPLCQHRSGLLCSAAVGQHSVIGNLAAGECVKIPHPLARDTLPPLSDGAKADAEVIGDCLGPALFGIKPFCEVHLQSLGLSKHSVKL
jgi:hypothetical protein